MCIAPCREFYMDVGLTSNASSPNKTVEEQLGLVSSKYVYRMLRIHRPCFFCLPQFSIEDGRGRRLGSGKEKCISLCGFCPVKYDIWGPTSDPESATADY